MRFDGYENVASIKHYDRHQYQNEPLWRDVVKVFALLGLAVLLVGIMNVF